MNIATGAIARLRHSLACTTGLFTLVAILTATPLLPTSQTHTSATASTQLARTTTAQGIRLEVKLGDRQVRLYRGNTLLKHYPIGIGRPGWETPTGNFLVGQKKRNPAWISPFTNEEIPANDPRNPLGGYWIGFWTDGTNWIGFHGTPDLRTIGRAASHGCLHMRQNDLRDLFAQVQMGTPVKVVN